MKQIIPFKKELLFKTKVSEITSISLEHTLSLKGTDLISGEFHISGDYKMTEGSINRENFHFACPFEINLDTKYDVDSIIIDIDNFYYEVVNNESLQVNIDVYIEGEKIEEPEIIETTEQNLEIENKTEELESKLESLEISTNTIAQDREIVEEIENLEQEEIEEREDEKELIVDDSNFDNIIERINPKKVDLNIEQEPTININTNNNQEFNVFDNIDTSDTYVTYYVYIVKEEDTIDKILDNFNVTKEELENYNDLSNIKPKDKLIIPTHNE